MDSERQNKKMKREVWQKRKSERFTVKSSYAQHRVRPNKLKRWSLEQRKVYCRAMQGDEAPHALKSLKLPEGFRQSIFKGQVREGVTGYVISLCMIL